MKIQDILSPTENSWFSVALLAMLSLVAASPLFNNGWYPSHDGLWPLDRVMGLSAQISVGDYYPRWLFETYGGQGSPFFNFYTPGIYLFSAYLHCAGLPLTVALKMTAILIFFTGAWGIYLWTRKYGNQSGALFAAIIYLFAPYHFVDIYVRGALAEFGALSILPYIFHGIDKIFEPDGVQSGLLAIMISSCLLVLTHHLSVLMTFPFVLCYVGLKLWQHGNIGHYIKILVIGALGGAGLSTFYWLPMLLEHRYLVEWGEELTSGYFSYNNHFIYPWQWLSSFWGYGGSEAGPIDQMSFQVGSVMLAISLTGIAVTRLDLSCRRFWWWMLILGGLALLLTTSASENFYRTIPIFRFIQFPWRFLGLAVLFISASTITLSGLTSDRQVGLTLLVMIISLSILTTADYRAISQSIYVDYDHLSSGPLANRLRSSLTAKDEYLPRWADRNLINTKPELKPIAPESKFSGLKFTGSELHFIFDAGPAPKRVEIPWHYFPGWKVDDSGQEIAVEPSEKGYLSFSVPSGISDIRIWFGTTYPRSIGWMLSIVTLATLVGFMLHRRWIK
jgi:hypothetical protein